jgi:ABC-2 type transport system permease protein
MQTLALEFQECAAMSARSLRGVTRKLDTVLMAIVLPVFLMLLFVYVFGGALDVGAEYADYVVPGVIVLCAGFGAATTAVAVASDMENGVIDRFRTLPIMSASVLVGHVVTSVVTNVLATVIVIGVALATGFRPNATVFDWLGAAAVLLLFIVTLTWVATAIGLLVRNAEAANGATFFMLFLPYISSGFVPTETMPTPLATVADHQPFTPMIETIRGFLLGTPIGNNGWLTVLWFGGILVVTFVAATRLFYRHSV